MNELDLFTAALSIQDAQARAAYLDEHCKSNPPLRQRLEELLKAYGQADQVLPDVPAIDPNVTEMFTGQKQDHLLGTIIAGKYKLLEEIGEGGMGTVFVAEQTEPVKRKVAVKLIKPGMDSKSVLARFEAERQALAMMDHPNIARVLDAGLTEERRPYFVMEYIKGLPLTKYCDDVKLSIDERLKLFIQICQAVQHAHQKGIIHRDLKPTNILIALYDGKPVPKVIDFGLAKALHQSLTERTLHTGHEMVLGTPLYMSPEQAELNNLDIDTRSDIYSLGVILYELLTGVTPLEKQRFKEAAWAEVLRIIKEEEPSKPSTKLSHSESLPSVAAQRQMEPKKLSTLMKGDLDWIVMKALEKDRNRRYETANGFAADVLRYLSGEAVTAVPPSAAYRLRKFVKRNKVQVIAASLVLLALLAGIVGTSVGLYQANLARDAEARHRKIAEAKEREANDERAKAEAAAEQERQAKVREAARAEGERLAKLDAQQKEKLAVAARKAAVDMAAQSQAITDFLQFDLLRQADVTAQADAKFAPTRDLTIRVALDRAAEKVGSKFANRPNVEIAIRQTVGVTYSSLAEFDKAVVHLKRAAELAQVHFGPNHQNTLTIDHFLGAALLQGGRHAEAIPILERTLTASEKVLGEDHPETLISRGELALVYKQMGDLKRAIPLYERTLQSAEKAVGLGPFHEDTLTYANGLANAYAVAQRFDEAIALAVRVMEGRRKILGDSHPLTEQARSNLGGMYVDSKKYDLARPLLEQSFAEKMKVRGPDHPETLVTRAHLANCLSDLGETAEAIKHNEAILAAKLVTQDLPLLIGVRVRLASLYRSAGRPDLAVPLLRMAVEQAGTRHGPQSIEARRYTQHLAGALQLLQQFEESELLFRKLVEMSRTKDGPASIAYGTELAYLGNNLLCQRKWAEAESALTESRAIYERTASERWFHFHIQSSLGGTLLGQKKYAEAEPLLLKGYEGMKQREKSITGTGRFRLPEAIDRLIQLYTETNKPDEVKKWQAEKEKLTKSAEKK